MNKAFLTISVLSLIASVSVAAGISPGKYIGRTNTWLGGLTAKPCVFEVEEVKNSKTSKISHLTYRIYTKKSLDSDYSLGGDFFEDNGLLSSSLSQDGNTLFLKYTEDGMDQAHFAEVKIKFVAESNYTQIRTIEWNEKRTAGIFFPMGSSTYKCEYLEKITK